MVMAKLHLICGNCGSADMFKYRIETEEHDETGEEYQYVTLLCENCVTLHRLDDNAEIEQS